MFITKNNVPEFYVNQSRDFQLLCNAKDIIFNNVKYTINSINHSSNTLEINSRLLEVLKSKVGFFSKETLGEDQLRILLSGFPKLIQKKGSRQAITEAIHLWFRIYQLDGGINSLDIDNYKHEIFIRIGAKKENTALLDALFEYIVPSSYLIKYEFAEKNTYSTDLLFDDSDIKAILVSNKVNSNVSRDDKNYDDAIKNRLIHSVGLTEIATEKDLSESKVTPIQLLPKEDQIND